MKEINKIRKYFAEELSCLRAEITQYESLEKEVAAKIDHSSRYVLSMAASQSDEQNIFSPYGKRQQEELEEENQNLEEWNGQLRVVRSNLDRLHKKYRQMEGFHSELEQFADKDFYFIDCKKYDMIQDLLGEFQKELDAAGADFEKKMKKFLYVDPHRIQAEYQGYKQRVRELADRISDCEMMLSDTRRENR